eukprot:CCRYP_014644-RA/>CCRYP_014644-RA protein AED:0.49 eAED:0.49 QI:0/0/0/1/0/0/2/0/119
MAEPCTQRLVGPAKNHYRNYRFCIPSTKGYRTSGSAKFFPKHTKMPAIEPGDMIRLAAQDLIKAIHSYRKHLSTSILDTQQHFANSLTFLLRPHKSNLLHKYKLDHPLQGFTILRQLGG